jgi:hypothetical protein
MIAEIIPEAYDAFGRKAPQVSFLRGVRPTLPMGRYVSQPLAVKCETIQDICKFLWGCRARSDQDLFNKREYFQPPEEFERLKKGDCDDFALWTWRQFMALGYDARVVFGKVGRFGQGHAWVEFFQDNKCYLVEPQLRILGESMPRLSTLRYVPQFSASWDGKTLAYYAHKERLHQLSFIRLPGLIAEWVKIWGWFWVKVFFNPRLL